MPPLVESLKSGLTGLPEALETRVKRFQPRFHTPLVVLWLTLSIAGVVTAWFNWRELSEHVDRGVELAQFNDSLDRLFFVLLDAETGQRGYVITGDEAFLAPYTAAESSFSHDFDEFARRGLNEPDLQKQVLELKGLAELRLAALRKGIELRRNGGYSAASASVTMREGKALMDRIRVVIEQMRKVRPNLLTTPGDATRKRLQRASWTSLVAGILGVGLGFFAFYLARMGYVQERRERELAEAKLHAEQSNEQKSAFLANMSHEIRTPMNAIIGFADLLSSEVQEPRQRGYLRSIRAASDSLLQLINDVLDMSKIEAGLLELHPEPTDPREICEFLHTVFREQATKKGVKLTCDTAEDLPRSLLLDRTRLRQVLVNLVGNAVKFTERGSIRTHVKWEKQEQGANLVTLLIEVEDTGIGIPQGRLDLIFKPFVQAEPGRPQELQGTGLGLAIVRRLTEMMNGTVAVASVVGKGTIFHLRIPNVEISSRLPQAPSAPDRAHPDFNTLRPSRVLAVDDNELNRQLMGSLFARTHHELHLGSNGRDAVELARSLKPDVVLLDVRMPLVDGRTALEEIRATPGLEFLVIIAVTASSLADEEQELRRHFNGYVRKPFTPQTLYAELAQFVPRLAGPGSPEAGAAGAGGGLANGGPLPPGTTVDRTARWAELAVELHRLESSDWPTVKDSLAINEVRNFAARLRSLGEAAECGPLLDYADTLRRHAEAYDAAALEPELLQFPNLVSQIEARTV